jgi:excisionase family DNA binding protein
VVVRADLYVVASRPSLEELPEVLTVEEAAAVLRISRGAGYALARQYLARDGREGLPVVRLGRSLRVPRAKLLALLEADVEADVEAGGAAGG